MITLNKFLEKHSGEIKENMTIMLKNQELGELGLPTMDLAKGREWYKKFIRGEVT